MRKMHELWSEKDPWDSTQMPMVPRSPLPSVGLRALVYKVKEGAREAQRFLEARASYSGAMFIFPTQGRNGTSNQSNFIWHCVGIKT